jgi:hypothetical protein
MARMAMCCFFTGWTDSSPVVTSFHDHCKPQPRRLAPQGDPISFSLPAESHKKLFFYQHHIMSQVLGFWLPGGLVVNSAATVLDM